jgi:Spy/CpxP family protein refolding chaperone
MSKFAILVVVAGLLASLSAFAQDSSQPAPATPAAPAAKHAHRQGDRAEQRLNRLSKKLNLTDDQKEKIRPILQDEDKQLTEMEADSALTAQQKHKKTKEIRRSSRSQLVAILTPEQKEKLPSGKAGGEGRHHRHADQAGAPAPDVGTPPQ